MRLSRPQHASFSKAPINLLMWTLIRDTFHTHHLAKILWFVLNGAQPSYNNRKQIIGENQSNLCQKVLFIISSLNKKKPKFSPSNTYFKEKSHTHKVILKIDDFHDWFGKFVLFVETSAYHSEESNQTKPNRC